MKIYKIAVSGDNERLHVEAIKAAVAAVEAVNKAPVYRAWIENVDADEARRAQATGRVPAT